jgi:hypothetical protein
VLGLAALAGIVAFVLGGLIAVDADPTDPAEPLTTQPIEASIVVPTAPTTVEQPSVTTKHHGGDGAGPGVERARWDDGDDDDDDDDVDRVSERGKRHSD